MSVVAASHNTNSKIGYWNEIRFVLNWMKNGGGGDGHDLYLGPGLFLDGPCDLGHGFHGCSSSYYLSSERSIPCYWYLTFGNNLFPHCYESGCLNQIQPCQSRWLLKGAGVEDDLCDATEVAVAEVAEIASIQAVVEGEEKLNHLARKTEVAVEVQIAGKHLGTFGWHTKMSKRTLLGLEEEEEAQLVVVMGYPTLTSLLPL